MVDVTMPSMRRLKDKEVKGLLREVRRLYPQILVLESAKNIEELTVGEDVIYFVDGVPLFLRTKAGYLPSLKSEEVINSLPHVTVDMGAVAHIVNGADIMRPGVKGVQRDFGKGELVVIVDERHGKPIALGLTGIDSGEMLRMSRGKVIANIHYVGDDLWRALSKPD